MMYPYYEYGIGFGIFGLLWHLFWFILGIVLIVWLIRFLLGGSRHHRHHLRDMWGTHSALEILNERYAKGEIDKAEYEDRKKTILG